MAVMPGLDANGGRQIAFVYYDRLGEATLSRAVEDMIREEVRNAVLSDGPLRERVKAAIAVASATLPLEAITKAVKDAIRE